MTLDDVERGVSYFIGKVNFSRYSEYLFEKSFQEAPYLGIDPHKDGFSGFALEERAAGMAEMYHAILNGNVPFNEYFIFPGKMQIKVSLRRQYFNHLSLEETAKEFEPYVKKVFGKKNFKSLENWCFDYALKEAEVFGKKGEDLEQIALIRRGATILDVAETIDNEDLCYSEVIFPCEEVINKMVYEQMNSNALVKVEMLSNQLLPFIAYNDSE